MPMNGRRFTEQQRLWIGVAVALAGVVVAGTLFAATDRTAWPLLLVPPALVSIVYWLSDR
jgi:hypothetical protein